MTRLLPLLRLVLVAGSALCLASCDDGSGDPNAEIGANPKLPELQQYLMPPMHILNAPTKLMKGLGYGKDYAYDHHTEEGFSGRNYFPDGMARREFYSPVERGFEREIKKRLDYWTKLRERKSGEAG